MPHLIMDTGGQHYKIYNFTDSINIGRCETNDIVIGSPQENTISRRHTVIRKEKDQYILCDLSKNGTFVQQKKVSSLTLKDGLRFEIAGFGFTFVEDSPGQEKRQEQGPLNTNSGKVPDLPNDFSEEETVFFNASCEEMQRKQSLRAKLGKAGIIAHSDAMLALYRDVEEVAQVNVPVLILGEPGTGKEKIAQALHSFSGARGGFVPLNCSSIPEGIFESELFGSVKGAFSNATDKPGKLEQAENGTVFFDEIGDMAYILQPKLLRFLEDRIVTRLGDTRSRKVNVRFVAATNQNLDQMIRDGKFRGDLYQRLACVTLTVPPLRERKDDIVPLAEYFISRFCKEHGLPEQVLTGDGKQMLLNYSWPGNVRELDNVLLSSIIRNRTGRISSTSLALSQAREELRESEENAFLSLEEVEKRHIEEALRKAEGNKLLAAKLLGISRDTLYNKIRKYLS